ncbi:hypothetical protein ACO0LL_27750 [Undibacterium sp. TC4M20W]|uniref:hypothetical protein n=1 Tax=unclassified Undibacterium TaxID=2630295 RepID=UPI003BF03FCD
MTDFFDIQRFGRLLRAHWAESWREYAWFAGVLAILDLVIMVVMVALDVEHRNDQFTYNAQSFWYFTGLWCSAPIFTWRYFKYLQNPGACLIGLMRPASVFEKWLMAFLVIGLLYPLAYSLLYVILHYPAVQLAKAVVANMPVCEHCDRDFRFFFPFLTSGSTTGDDHSFLFHTYSFLLLSFSQALVAGGAVYFRRSPVLRTALVTFFLGTLTLLTGIVPQAGIFMRNWRYTEAYVHRPVEYVLSFGLWLGVPVLLWGALYFHIREREVA